MSNNKMILIAVIFSLLFSCVYIFTNRLPERFPFGSEIMDFLNILATSTLAASIFYLFQVFLPEERKRKALKYDFKLNYTLFKKDCIYLFLGIIRENQNPDLVSKLLKPEQFKIYFKRNFKRDQTKWHGVLNGLNQKILNDLLTQLEILSQETDYFLNNVPFRDETVFAFLKRLKIAVITLLKNTSLEKGDNVETLSNFLWELFAGWSFVGGYRKNDIFEEMLEKI